MWYTPRKRNTFSNKLGKINNSLEPAIDSMFLHVGFLQLSISLLNRTYLFLSKHIDFFVEKHIEFYIKFVEAS